MDLSFKKIIKRDGRVVPFNQEKITNAIFAAARAAGGKDHKKAVQLSNLVIKALKKKVKKGYPSIELIQDTVEKVLIEEGHARTAKAYISYRQKRADIRLEKMRVLDKDSVDEVDKAFDLNALRVLTSRYLRKDETGKIIESPKQLFTRVAVHVALPELIYDYSVYAKGNRQKKHKFEKFDPAKQANKFEIGSFKLNEFHLEALKRMYDRSNKQGRMKIPWKKFLQKLKAGKFDKYEPFVQQFFDLMVSKKFLPNTPAIANFGNPLGMGSACFVLDIDDNMEGIMETLKKTALVFKAGGGMGYNFSKLRPEGDFVSTTSGVASGPLSFMRLFDTMTDVIKQGGVRRGANMGILNSNHPDIEKFITAKEGNKALTNFNISVMVMPEFWECLEKNKPYPLLSPRTGKPVREVNPKMLFDLIVHHTWDSAEPGLIYFDHVNNHNPFLDSLGPILSTNPCVSSDSLISTGKGLERIDSLKAENIAVDVRTITKNNSNNTCSFQRGVEFVKPKQVIKTGFKECHKLVTNSGYELTATPDHKILTENGWKQLIDLTEKDNVLIQSGFGDFNSNPKLPFEVKNEVTISTGRKYSFNLPNKWSKELGLVMGWLVGDGWLNTKHNNLGLVFSRDDEEARELIQPIFEEYCNRKTKLVNPNDSCRQIRTNSKFVVDFFSKLGVKSVQEERAVPESIFTASEEAVYGFLSGLFSADGTIGMGSKSRNYIRLNSSSIKLLKDTQLLLLNLGIRSSIYNRSTKPKTFTYTKANGESIEYKTSGVNYELNVSKENIPRFLEKIDFIQSRHKKRISKLKEFEFYSEYFFDKVKSIESVGKKEVWDITESKTHSFIANGIVVHNCGEVVLYPNESCNLGSINIWNFVSENGKGKMVFDWNALAKTIRLSTWFLDNVIDVNKFPLKEIEEMTLSTRKVGLGLMGLGDTLYELGLSYDSKKGLEFMEQVMEFINYHSKIESIELAKTRGSFPYYKQSFYSKGKLPFKGFDEKKKWKCNWKKIVSEIKKHGIRNGFTTVIAPTGSISMIAGCSSGIEPVYSLVFEKHVKVGSFYYVNPVFEKIISEEGLFDDDLLEDVVRCKGSVKSVGYIPPKFKSLFVTAHDIEPEEHIRALAAFQNWTDSSISKTINFPANATVEEMKKCYILAHKLGCKDVTAYRDTSIKDQVLVTQKKKKKSGKQLIAAYTDEERPTETLQAPIAPTDSGSGKIVPEEEQKCPNDNTPLVMKEGCMICPVCGWGKCGGG